MFRGATAFNQDLSNWNVEAVEDMKYLFWDASAFNQTLCWSLTARVDQRFMFDGSGGGSIDCP
jgi:surface protein